MQSANPVLPESRFSGRTAAAAASSDRGILCPRRDRTSANRTRVARRGARDASSPNRSPPMRIIPQRASFVDGRLRVVLARDARRVRDRRRGANGSWRRTAPHRRAIRYAASRPAAFCRRVPMPSSRLRKRGFSRTRWSSTLRSSPARTSSNVPPTCGAVKRCSNARRRIRAPRTSECLRRSA